MPNIQFQLRRGTAATWTSTNPILADGELGFETDTRQLKVGNDTAWNLIPYLNIGQAANWSAFPAYQTVDFSSNVISNASRVINGPGTVTVPSYTFFNDLSMGLYDASTNVMGFVTSGAERMRIASNGNVGIGTNNPQKLLDLSSATGSDGINITAKNAQVNVFDPSSGTIANALALYQGPSNHGLYTNNTTFPLIFWTAGSNRMTILSNGNVGIGRTNPPHTLSVGGLSSVYQSDSLSNTRVTHQATAYSANPVTSDTIIGQTVFAANDQFFATMRAVISNTSFIDNIDLRFTTNASTSSGTQADRMTIKAFSGNVGIGTNNPADSRLEVIVSSATDNNVFKLGETNNNLRMTAGSSYGAIRYTDGAGTTRGGGMYFNTNGVGIGETAPPHRLTVVGNVHVSNAANQIMGLFSPNYGQYLHIGAWNTSGSVSSNIVLNQFGGTVGIRTNSLDSAYALHVRSASGNGMIRADNSWGQFVLAVYNDNESWTDWGSATSIVYIGSTKNTDRSINTGGSVNTFGTDYAEYMFKDQTDRQFTIQKGDIAGVTSNGLLTDIYDSAVTFVVKSTKPSFVGGDAWARREIFGEKPTKPSDEATQEEKDAYVTALTEWETRYETERQKVDRIAFSGQVPVNISNATPGDYIVPMRTETGGIVGIAVSDSNITFDQYRKAVGKVIKNLGEGKSLIIVKMP